MRLLVDLDGVVVNWTKQFEDDLALYYPSMEFAPMREFSTPTYLPKDQQLAINMVKYRSGFYADMKPVRGAKKALKEIVADGHDLWFCSSPEVFNPTCESDKKTWLMTHFGEWWAKRLILTRDKTLVRGDILIDDRPDVDGAVDPEWVHVLFSQTYNDHVTDKPRLDKWSQWQDALENISY